MTNLQGQLQPFLHDLICIYTYRDTSRMCRDILNSCVRNTEEAEKNSKSPESGNAGGSGRGLGKGVWGMIEESELAKTIRQGDGTSVSRHN